MLFVNTLSELVQKEIIQDFDISPNYKSAFSRRPKCCLSRFSLFPALGFSFPSTSSSSSPHPPTSSPHPTHLSSFSLIRLSAHRHPIKSPLQNQFLPRLSPLSPTFNFHFTFPWSEFYPGCPWCSHQSWHAAEESAQACDGPGIWKVFLEWFCNPEIKRNVIIWYQYDININMISI